MKRIFYITLYVLSFSTAMAQTGNGYSIDLSQVQKNKDVTLDEVVDVPSSVDPKIAGQISKLENKIKKAERDSITAGEKLKQLRAQLNILLNGDVQEIEQGESQVSEVQIISSSSGTTVTVTPTPDNVQTDNAEILRLRRQLKELESFKRMWLQQLAASVDTKWLSKSYSEIDLEELESDYEQYNEYADSDPQVKIARDKLTALVEECQIYKEGVRCVNSRFNKPDVASSRQKVTDLRDRLPNGKKKDEVSELADQLRFYGTNIKLFKNLIVAIDNSKGGRTDHRKAIGLVEDELKSQTEEGVIEAINNIPWLKTQFEQYLKDLKKDCIKDSPVKQRILDISI